MKLDRFNKRDIVHIRGVDHPESLSVGPHGEVYTTGTGGQVYRVDLASNTATAFAGTQHRCLGQAVDADGNLYCAHTVAGEVVVITPAGETRTYAAAAQDRRILCANYPVFDREGNMYLSDSGDWSDTPSGWIYKIPRGGGEAVRWFLEALDTPNSIALDADERHLYYVETWGASICRIAIQRDGSAGHWERVVHLPRHVPDGIAFDREGRLWIACHRPDKICVYDLSSRRLETFVEDWMGHYLRGPTDIVFAGPERDVILASSLDNLCIHRMNGTGVIGQPLNHPRISGP